VETSSSSVTTTRLIDYPSFMDASGFTTTIKNTPTKVVVLNSSLAEIWMLAGGSIDITIKETITRGLVIESEVKVIDQPTTDKSNYELLLSYDPDLVILDANNDAHLKLAETLRVYNIPVFVLRVDSFLNYLSTLSMFTKILNTPNNFEKYGNKLLNQVEAIVDSTKTNEERKKVLLLSADNSIENTDLSKHFIYHMLEELGALPVTANDVNNTLDNEASETKDVDLILNLSLKENIELFSYLPNQRWAQVYQYLVDLLYGGEKE
jgi:ABC-type Fe3+-hydroxamate transport system substrate-binding protein